MTAIIAAVVAGLAVLGLAVAGWAWLAELPAREWRRVDRAWQAGGDIREALHEELLARARARIGRATMPSDGP